MSASVYIMRESQEEVAKDAYGLFLVCWQDSPYVDGEFHKVWEHGRRALDALQYEYSVEEAAPLPYLAYKAVDAVRAIATRMAASCVGDEHRSSLGNLMVVYAEVWALWQDAQALHPEASPFSKS